MCEIPKMPIIYDYNRDKMGIIQNEVVWSKKHGGMIFAMIAKIQGIAKFKISLCTVTFSMVAKFR